MEGNPRPCERSIASRGRAYKDRIQRVSCVGLPGSCPDFLRSYEDFINLREYRAVYWLPMELSEAVAYRWLQPTGERFLVESRDKRDQASFGKIRVKMQNG